MKALCILQGDSVHAETATFSPSILTLAAPAVNQSVVSHRELNNEMVVNKKIKIPLRFRDLINLAFWHEVIDLEELHDLKDVAHPSNCIILSDGSVHYYWMCVRRSKYVRALISSV